MCLNSENISKDKSSYTGTIFSIFRGVSKRVQMLVCLPIVLWFPRDSENRQFLAKMMVFAQKVTGFTLEVYGAPRTNYEGYFCLVHFMVMTFLPH